MTYDDSGRYFCVVKNNCGFDTSLVDTLGPVSAVIAPKITINPQDQSLTIGDSATFSVVATGTQPLTYQWQKNGVGISGADSATYKTPPTTLADDSAFFRCIVSNSVGSDTSEVALLRVSVNVIAPKVTVQPQGQGVTVGNTATFTIVTTGTNPVYQWRKNSVNISGAKSSSYETLPATLADDGTQFRCIVSNSAGSDTSDAATLTVTETAIPPQITAHPVNDTVIEGLGALFSVITTGTNLKYQWQKNGGDIANATANVYIIPITTASDNGSLFQCIVSNSMDTVTSDAAILIVHYAPVITGQPQSQTVNEGSLVTFIVEATGKPSPTFQWQKDGVNITDATNSTYQIPSVQASDAGNYTVDVMNTVDTITSNVAVLTVHTAPVISIDPRDTTIVANNPVTFTVVASGNPSPKYQWKKNGVAISGQTNGTFQIASVQTSDVGSYSVDVMNVVDTVTSKSAILTVHTAPVISSDPKDSTVILNNPVSFTVVASGIPSPTYQWQKDVGGGSYTDISGATGSTYQIASTQKSDAGNYRVKVMNVVDTAKSNFAVLTVHYAPIINTNPRDTTVRIGDTVTFSVLAEGSPAPLYQWTHDGSNINGAKNSSYTINSVEPAHGGNYAVKVSNTVGSVTSMEAVLTVNMEFLDRRDDHVYKVIQIGDQIWMADNLNYNAGSGSWYYDDDPNKGIIYGRLYDWHTATTDAGNGKDVCPQGWRLPTKTEFEILVANVGGSDVAAKKLKSTTLWDSQPGTDDYEFTALPAGINDIYYLNGFVQLCNTTYFWASTSFDSENADDLMLDNSDDSIISYMPKDEGMSIRCIKE